MSNPNTDAVILNALALTITATPGTAFLTQGGGYYIEDEYVMAATGGYPVMQFMTGSQSHARKTLGGYDGQMQVIVKYLNRFDLVNVTIDAVRRAIRDDLNLMKDYLLGNDTLAFDNLEHARGIPQVLLSPYKGEVEDIPGVKVVSRTMVCIVNILDYDVP
jgi:hypothetical protein